MATLELTTGLKLNMGCGHNKKVGYVNVDRAPACVPDVVCDLEQTPWPWPDSSVSEVVFFHALEHMGEQSAAFLAIMQELYRVCAPNAVVHITVPHPRHDNFLGDPTHVRIITPKLMELFSLANCDKWKELGWANTPFAHYLNVDFETTYAEVRLDEPYLSMLNSGQIKPDEMWKILNERNNIAGEYIITLRVVKN
jgi:hypothetical protein